MGGGEQIVRSHGPFSFAVGKAAGLPTLKAVTL